VLGTIGGLLFAGASIISIANMTVPWRGPLIVAALLVPVAFVVSGSAHGWRMAGFHPDRDRLDRVAVALRRGLCHPHARILQGVTPGIALPNESHLLFLGVSSIYIPASMRIAQAYMITARLAA